MAKKKYKPPIKPILQQPRDHQGKFVKFPEVEIRLTPNQLRQHMRLEKKYEAMKNRGHGSMRFEKRRRKARIGAEKAERRK